MLLACGDLFLGLTFTFFVIRSSLVVLRNVMSNCADKIFEMPDGFRQLRDVHSTLETFLMVAAHSQRDAISDFHARTALSELDFQLRNRLLNQSELDMSSFMSIFQY